MGEAKDNEKENPRSSPEKDEKGSQNKSGGEKDKNDDREKSSDKKDSEEPKTDPVYKKPGFIITVSILAVALVAGGLVFWLIAREYVSTDDAYVDGHVVQISPQVAAPVLELRIIDNQFVHKGDLLVRLDPTDYEVALKQAQAQVSAARGRLEQAKAQVVSAATAVPQAEAERDAARATLNNASRDRDRFERLDDYARSREQLDNVRTTAANAQAQFAQSNAKVLSAEAGVKTAEAAIKAAEGDLQTAEANENKAKVNLSYCKIFAPIDGRVTERTVEAGNYVTAGQALFLLVDPDVWVTANFKETQLTHLRPGQPATIKVDAFPGHKFQGHVDSIQAGSGARFSVLPVENATGNYVKVVQRVPVKIIFDHGANTNNAPMLSPGLSVIPRVKVR